MDNDKYIGWILLGISGLVFLGVSSYWDFETWINVDWIIIIVCGISGIALISQGGE